MKPQLIYQGAEAIITREGCEILKKRIKKSYRIPELDNRIRRSRTKKEAKIFEKIAKVINVPKIIKADEKNKEIIMEFIDGKKLSDYLDNIPLEKAEKVMLEVGKQTAKMHDFGVIHGDLTTSNMILKEDKVYFVDFGLGFFSNKVEDKAVDLHLLKQALEAKHFKNWEKLFQKVSQGYKNNNSTEVLERLKIVESRGRYKKH